MAATTMSASPPTIERNPGRWAAAYAVIAGALAVVLDGALMGLISPSVAADLGANAATISLLSSISTLMMAAFILGGGTLGDIYGRKRFLTYGLIGMIATAVLAMLAPTAAVLIPIRALTGVMAALINPLALAIITVSFDAEERPKALGLYGAAIGIGGGLGTLVISFLNQQFGWRSTFVLDIVLGGVALVLVQRFVQESKAEGAKRMDWLGIVLAAVGLVGIIFGINQAGANGFASPAVLGPVGVGVVVLLALIFYSRSAKDPVLKLELFKNHSFSVGLVLALVLTFASTGAFFFLSNYLQSLQRVSPIGASLTLLPYTLSLFVFAILTGRWVGKRSNQLLIAGGLVVMAGGLVAMALWLNPAAGFWAYFLPMVLLGSGFSIANTPRVTVVLGSAPPTLAGSASATNNAAVQLGTALGIAVLGALFQGAARNAYINDLTQAGVSNADIVRSADVLAAWLRTNSGDVASQFGITVQQLAGVISNYENAFTTGVVTVLWIAAAAVAAAAALAFFTFRTARNPSERPAVASGPGAAGRS